MNELDLKLSALRQATDAIAPRPAFVGNIHELIETLPPETVPLGSPSAGFGVSKVIGLVTLLLVVGTGLFVWFQNRTLPVTPISRAVRPVGCEPGVVGSPPQPVMPIEDGTPLVPVYPAGGVVGPASSSPLPPSRPDGNPPASAAPLRSGPAGTMRKQRSKPIENGTALSTSPNYGSVVPGVVGSPPQLGGPVPLAPSRPDSLPVEKLPLYAIPRGLFGSKISDAGLSKQTDGGTR